MIMPFLISKSRSYGLLMASHAFRYLLQGPLVHRIGLVILALPLQHQAKATDDGERVRVLWPQYLLSCFYY